MPTGETTTESVSDRTTDRESTATTTTEEWAETTTDSTTATPTTMAETTSESQSNYSIVIDRVRADAPGKDSENLNGEEIELKNTGAEPVNMTGWEIHDEDGNTFVFPDGFVLEPNASVVVHSGAGQNSSHHLYWNAEKPIWDNGGDYVRVVDSNGDLCGMDCAREILEVQ